MTQLSKLRRPLDGLLPVLRLEPPELRLLRGCSDAVAGLDRLQSAGALIPATRLGAFALPKREAVWWASMCVAHTAPPDQPELEIKIRATAELWVRRQDDASRREAMDLARAAGFGLPDSWVAVGAFWSGDSMAPLGQPIVPPAPHLTGTAVAGAVALAAVRGNPAHQVARLERFLGSLRAIGDGEAGRLAPEPGS